MIRASAARATNRNRWAAVAASAVLMLGACGTTTPEDATGDAQGTGGTTMPGADDGRDGTGGASGAGGVAAPTGGVSEAGGSPASGGFKSSVGLCFDPKAVPSCESMNITFNSYFSGETEPMLLRKASDLSESATFIALDGHAVLVFDPEAPLTSRYSILLAPSDVEAPQFRTLSVSWPGVDEEFTFSAVLRGDSSPGSVLALGCSPEKCLRFAAGRGDTALLPIDEPALPKGLDGYRLSESEACVFGDRVLCLEGDVWREHSPLPEGTGSFFVYLQPNFTGSKEGGVEYPTIAVTDQGALLTALGHDPFEMLDPPKDDFRSVMEFGGVVSLVGGEEWSLVDTIIWKGESCSSGVERTFGVAQGDLDGSLLTATQTGEVFVRSYRVEGHAAWCMQSKTIPRDLFAFSVTECGAMANVFAISSTELWSLTGDFGCPLVP